MPLAIFAIHCDEKSLSSELSWRTVTKCWPLAFKGLLEDSWTKLGPEYGCLSSYLHTDFFKLHSVFSFIYLLLFGCLKLSST